ncbi:hypothetical protein V8F33_009339 [Rhypophila sp. PSN 637]
MAPTLFSLPNELQVQICKALDETDTAALWSFAQANRHAYSIAKTRLFHTITFHLTTPQQLAQDVHSCEKLLHRNGDDSFAHVRRVVVTGKPVPSVHCDESTWQIHSPPPIRWDANYERLHCIKSLGHPDSTASETSVFQGSWFLHRSPVRDRDWEPLVNILGQFPGLRDLEFNCSNPVICSNSLPLSLLRTLEKRRPIPRLHISEGLRSVLAPRARSIDPHELAILSSPCLFRLCIQPGNFYQHEIMKAVPTLAPNLKEMGYFGHDSSLQSERANEGRPSFQELLPTLMTSTAKHPSHITSFEIWGDPENPGIFGPMTLRTLTLDIHSKSLRVLRIHISIHPAVLDALLNTTLPALSHLAFTCYAPSRYSPNCSYLQTTKKLFKKLPQLSSLELQAWDHDAEPLDSLPANLRTLLLTHGHPTLFENVNRSVIRKEEIVRISQECLHIEDLSLTMQRSRGNAAEVAKYRAIGGFSQLRRLTLTLAAEPMDLPSKEYNDTDYPFSRPQFFKSVKITPSRLPFPNVQFLNDEVPGTRTWPDRWRPRRGHLMELMVNYALDPELAASIFRTIWRSNARSRQAESRFSSPSSSPATASGFLERMLIRTWGDSSFWGHPLGNSLVRYRQGLCRAYAVKVAPSGGGDNPSGGLVKRELPIGLKGLNGIPNLGSDPRSSGSVHYFRNLWPVEDHGVLGSPRGWSSFPLELDATEAMESDVNLEIRTLKDPTVSRDWL